MPLTLTGTVAVAASPDQLYDHLAMAWSGAAGRAVGERGVFHVALSGGSTPEPFYTRLVIDPRYRNLPWDKTHLWIVDERRVAEDHEKSNYRMIRQTLVDHVPVRKRQVHPMPVLRDDAAEAYEAELRGLVAAEGLRAGDEPPRLDFVVLGMGDDAHTASLFPGSPAIAESRRWVVINAGPNVTPPDRVTMTYPLLNAARELAVLVVGAKKHVALKRVDDQLRQGGPDPVRFPITGIDPALGELTWYLDQAAANPA